MNLDEAREFAQGKHRARLSIDVARRVLEYRAPMFIDQYPPGTIVRIAKASLSSGNMLDRLKAMRAVMWDAENGMRRRG